MEPRATTKPVRCTASGQERMVTREEWSEAEGTCPDCGGRAPFWVRGTDLAPRLKIRAHDAPPGVTPAPNAHANALHAAEAAALPAEQAPTERVQTVFDPDEIELALRALAALYNIEDALYLDQRQHDIAERVLHHVKLLDARGA